MSAYVIPQRCGPQQLPAMDEYQLQTVRSVNERIRKHTNPPQCNRCGESTLYTHFCKAASRMCYICRNYGNYAKFCILSPRQLAGSSICVATTASSKQQKSQKKQQRDKNRYLQFVERKSVCVEMPYYSLNNDELKQCLPSFQYSNFGDRKFKKLEKACVSHVNLIQDLSTKTKSLQEAINYEQKRHRKTETNLLMAEHQIDHLKNLQTCKTAEHQEIQTKFRDEIQALNSVNDQLQQNKSTVKQLQQNIQDQQTQIQQQKSENMKLTSENSELDAKIQNMNRTQKRLQNENRQLKKELNSMDCEISELIHTKGKLEHAIEGFTIALTSCRSEIQMICEVFEIRTSSLEEKAIKFSKIGFKCDNCGSTFFHDKCTSSLLGTCGLCHEPGHYTAFCTRVQELISM